MNLEVLYFGGLRPLVSGTRSERITVPDGSSLDAVVEHLCASHQGLDRFRDHMRIAVNAEFADAEVELADGDTVALIPPVAGGATTTRRLSDEPLRPEALIAAVSRPGQGGIAVFIGTVRDHNNGRDVTRLDYEAYPEMAERVLADIVERCEALAPGVLVAVAHRVGELDIGDAAVAIAASAPHRAEAFEACRTCIELIKQDLPIWKRELSTDGEEWIGLRP